MEQAHLELRGIVKHKAKSYKLPVKKVADGVNTTYMLVKAAGQVPLKADGYQAILQQTAEGQILYKSTRPMFSQSSSKDSPSRISRALLRRSRPTRERPS